MRSVRATDIEAFDLWLEAMDPVIEDQFARRGPSAARPADMPLNGRFGAAHPSAQGRPLLDALQGKLPGTDISASKACHAGAKWVPWPLDKIVDAMCSIVEDGRPRRSPGAHPVGFCGVAGLQD